MHHINKINHVDDLVSIIMPAYNAGKFIEASITSVIQQTYDKWELIIINDCSTDNTLEILKNVNDSRISIINNERNLGVAETRNNGLMQAKGQYLAFLDSDDLWLKDKLRIQVIELKANVNAICCHGSFQRIDEFNNVIGMVNAVNYVDYKLMQKGNFIGNLTGIIDRNKINFAIQQKNIKHEDYLMWLEILKSNNKNHSIGIKYICAKYRVHTKSVSANKFNSMHWHWSILRSQLKLGLFTSIKNIICYVYYAVQKRS